METNASRTEGRVRNNKQPSSLNNVAFSLNRNEKLKTLINDVVKTHLQFKRTNEEVTDIRTAVDEYVDNFSNYLHEVGLDVSRKYPVGSMAENTRMNEPDEFDFILGLLNYTEDVIEIEICQEHPDEGMHLRLRVKNDNNIELDYENKFYTIKGGIDQKMKQNDVIKRSGKLEWKGLIPYHQGPAMTCVFVWTPIEGKPLEISVDIVLAMERSGVPDVITQHNTCCKKYVGYMEEYFIIKQLYKKEPGNNPGNNQFKFAFTTTEVKLMNTKLSENHKTCFMFLKFLFGQGCRYKPSSYQMKILTLKHAAECEDDEVDMIGCLEDILTRLYHLFETTHDRHETTKQSLFLPDISLLSKRKQSAKSDGVLKNIKKIFIILNSLEYEKNEPETTDLFQKLSDELR